MNSFFRRFTSISMLMASLLCASYNSRGVDLRVPLMSVAPVLDGTVDESEWAGTVRLERLNAAESSVLAGGAVSLWVGSDGRDLFVAMVSETPPDGALLRRVAPAPHAGNARVRLDDNVEITITPAVVSGGRARYHAVFNARNAIWDMAYDADGQPLEWRGNWRLASSIIGERWHFEAALPLADIGLAAEDLQQPLGLRIGRNWRRTAGAEHSHWGEDVPRIIWDSAAPVAQVLRLQNDAGEIDIGLTVYNNQTAPLNVRAEIEVRPSGSMHRNLSELVTVAGGETRVVELQTGSAADELIQTLLRVTSEEGDKVYCRREFEWTRTRPEPFFLTEMETRAGVSFAYYPTHDIIHVNVDYRGMRARERVSGVELEVRTADGRAVAATRMPAAEDYQATMDWQLPSLKAFTQPRQNRDVFPLLEFAEGHFELVVKFAGVAAEPLVEHFARHVFPWEGNELGKSAIIVPPFTPIEVEGRTLDTVLRSHSLDDLGLWAQVTSLDQPLLQEPMRLEVRSGATTETAQGTLNFLETRPNRVVTASQWTAGNLRGSTAAEWDYDGMVKWTLTIEPDAAEIESVRLVVPLDDALMPLMHACVDGLRSNYAGYTPAGQGRIWDGSRAGGRRSIIGSYVPYIWVGAEDRGIAVFGENDSGWITDPEVPCQELVRTGDRLELVLNLIARPAVIESSRTIVIGFMATPAKPMPLDWRRWAFWNWRLHGSDATINRIGWVGSAICWGALGYCNEIYPMDGDLSIWRKLGESRVSGSIDQEFMTQWIEKWARAWAGVTRPTSKFVPGLGWHIDRDDLDEDELEKLRQRYRPNIRYGFSMASRTPPEGVVVYYTNARGVRLDTPEGLTFLNEWVRYPFSQRRYGYGGGHSYDLDPVASYRDYAMWYYKELLQSGACDYIYWDDIFMQSNFSTVSTHAYRLPDGRLQPASGIFNMRELIRRTAVLQHEMGHRACNVPHTTNTHLAPVTSFGQVNFTWEEKDGERNFQDRFSRDYIRAESSGRQSGNFPLVMLRITGSNTETHEWLRRTAAGVALTHELRISEESKPYVEHFKRLIEFGYGLPEVRVSQYWKQDHPVSVSGIDAATLVCGKPGAALVVICDYGDGGEAALRLDRAALGLHGALRAIDTESGETLAQENGAFPVILKIMVS